MQPSVLLWSERTPTAASPTVFDTRYIVHLRRALTDERALAHVHSPEHENMITSIAGAYSVSSAFIAFICGSGHSVSMNAR